MGGDSLHNVYLVNLDEHAPLFEAASTALKNLGHPDASFMMEEAAMQLRTADCIRDKMREVLRELENYLSCKGSKESVNEAVEEWRKSYK